MLKIYTNVNIRDRKAHASALLKLGCVGRKKNKDFFYQKWNIYSKTKKTRSYSGYHNVDAGIIFDFLMSPGFTDLKIQGHERYVYLYFIFVYLSPGALRSVLSPLSLWML